jgi:hypothetical protein
VLVVVSDLARAAHFVSALTGEAEAEMTEILAAQFGAVRAEERAAIVAWLRRTALEKSTSRDFQSLATASNDVERGAHAGPSS